MTDLDEKARRVLELARQSDAPSAADAARIRAGLEARLLLDPTLLVPGAAKVFGTATLALKEVLVALGLGSAVGLATASIASWAATPPSAVDAPATDASALTVRDAARPRALASATRSVLPPESAEQKLTKAFPDAHVIGKADAPAARDSLTNATDPARAELAAELEGLRRAQEHLHRGNPGEALAVLAELGRVSPSHVLDEEREATRLMARCASGARESAGVSAFSARFPNSVHGARVTAACADGKKMEPASTEPAMRAH